MTRALAAADLLLTHGPLSPKDLHALAVERGPGLREDAGYDAYDECTYVRTWQR
jgi:hypothetical protein